MSLDDDPRDPHLLAALRHAPDRDLAPPPQLTAAILDHAQRALHVGRADGSRWRAAWAQLWQPAPMAAFGTVAMATLIGVLWSGQEIPDATPSLRSAPASVAAPTASNQASGMSAAPMAAQDSAPTAPPPERPPTAAPAPRPPTPASKASPLARAAESSLPLPSVPRPAPAPAPAAAPPAPTHERQAAAAQESEARRDAAAVAPPAPVTSAAPSVVATPAAPKTRDALAKALADAAPAQAGARARSEMPSGALGAALPAAAPSPVSPLASVDSEIEAATATDPARVRWRVAGQRVVAHQALQRDWWAEVLRATQGRWQTVASGADGVEPASLLMIDTAPRGSFVFEPQALVWREAGGAMWRAPIDAETLRRWQASLAHW
ncbi:MAG: hypothetical protein V4792_17025 [Pseudomonadota bacterium]